ncbi:sugar transferase [Lacicoccus alkaliphilus]|uniref:Sugar transferase involved in LPS biosynthesis (Colanic, teichoic acid) n=1 Tax=Lacicoccus alkaliphilus DSM 16010 TaxID=1123231 RepID=A0A1M7FVR8_9BACL|nr:sugar transferase [Salinicoccus alkaliphilus]SHM08161.1 Sugar transferase involved in LPS biosynthesis (colanic, teichoic acid) [Salinicoccus alkaliphilus DSM 16010]
MYKSYFKRVLDFIFSLLLLPVFIPIVIIFGLMIYSQDKGPIFYNANRLGMNGKIFKMYKFRSMKVDAPDLRNEDGSTFNAEDDPRLTNIGKFIRKTSIDETPQLLNIIKGDMSFVGPRPDLPEQYKLYEGNEKRKLEVRPGVTGYNQAYFRNTIPWKQRIKNDIYYIDKLTFMLDLIIIFKTILTVISRENVFTNQEQDNKSTDLK